jgi:DNA-binding beta-propeller fold protein YncE
MRLLIVEDEPRIAELLRAALGRAGFVADTVTTCADARAVLPLNPYAAAGSSQNTVEVIDLKAGKRIFRIHGQSLPQGVFYSAEFKKLFVANGRDGTVKIFSGDTFDRLDSLSVGTNPDHVGYDPATKYLYVGVRLPNSTTGALSIIETRTNKQLGVIRAETHPGAIRPGWVLPPRSNPRKR